MMMMMDKNPSVQILGEVGGGRGRENTCLINISQTGYLKKPQEYHHFWREIVRFVLSNLRFSSRKYHELPSELHGLAIPKKEAFHLRETKYYRTILEAEQAESYRKEI